MRFRIIKYFFLSIHFTEHKMTTRVIALVDMDCFYCQVEEKLNPELQGKPVAVVQYNLWREGGIIAANYLAKDKGVTKGMWKHEAKDVCPEIEFARVAELRGRADLTKYREAGNQVVEVLSTFTNLLERASIDEAYLDLTEAVKQELMKGMSNIPLEKLRTTHIVGLDTAEFISNISADQDTDGFCEDDLKLAIGGIIVERIRASIYEKTGYRCSAGIAHNKILAKLVCGLHKPNKQTILPGSGVPQFFAELPLKKIKRLGGKFGKKVAEELNITKVGELLKFSEKELIKKFDQKTGHWLYNIAKGIDNEPVSPKILSKSLSCCKRFPGKNALFKQKDVEHWIKELAVEVAERLAKEQEANNRKAKMATVSFVQDVNKNDVSSSKTLALRSYEADIIARDAFEVVRKACCKPDGSYYLKYLGISVGSFEEIKNIKDIKFFFAKTKTGSEQDVNKKIGSSKPDNESGVNIDEQFQSSVINNFSSSICGGSSEKTKDKNDLNNSGNEIDKIVRSENIAECVQDTQEAISSTNSKTEVISGEIQNSFFTRYFKKTTTEIICNSKDNSTFSEPSTSCTVDKFNEDFTPYTSGNCDNYEKIDRQFENIENSENCDIDENSDNKEIISQKCEECGKDIRIDELSSHNDYHFALKLQEQDSTTDRQNSKKNTTNLNQSSRKRKACEFGSASLDLFLKSEVSRHEEDTETCEMCNKKIRISELLSHFDYHAAKNLHKMLNTQSRSCDGNSNRNHSEQSSGIMRFLKRKSS